MESILAATLLLVLPASLITLRFLVRRPLIDRVVVGASAGLAGSITVGHILAAAGLLQIFWPLHALLAVAAVVVWLTRPRIAAPPGEPWLRVSLAVLAVVAALYAIPALSVRFPPGWDPAFHSILAEKILRTGALAGDWLPFENVPVNYTQGGHVMVAIISHLSGKPVHEVIALLPLFIQTLAVLQVGVLGKQIFGDARIQPLAMIVYGLFSHLGSFSSYFEWGGLPTEVGGLFLLSIVSAALHDDRRVSIALMVLLFGSLAMTHHLSALIATAVVLSHVVLSYATSAATALARRLLEMLVIAGIAYSFYVIPYAMRVASIGDTETLRYAQDTMKSLPAVIGDLGVVVVILAAAGLVFSVPKSGEARTEEEERQNFLLSWLTTLVFAFAVLGYLWRYVVWMRTGDDVSPFTPSRWITFAAYPLALYAARSLTVMLDVGRRHLDNRFPAFESLFTFALLAAAVATAAPTMLQLRRQPLTPAIERAFRRAGQVTPPNALLVLDATSAVGPGAREWLPYLSWRSSLFTPLPASENQTTVSAKQQAFRSGDPNAIVGFLRSQGLQLWVVTITRGGDVTATPVPETQP